MTDVLEEFKSKFARKALVMEIGGFRPSEDLTSSWFGRVHMGNNGEGWPMQNGRPMLPLAQINLTELPFRTPGLEDIDFITVFISPQKLPFSQDENGSSWVLRTYNSIAGLIPLEMPELSSPIKPFQMRSQVIEQDYPCFDDVPMHLRKQLWDAYQNNHFENTGGFKLGGWPTLIQSELDWNLTNYQIIHTEYVFQIDTTKKGNWSWGDNGVGYFGRIVSNGFSDAWILEWQCF